MAMTSTTSTGWAPPCMRPIPEPAPCTAGKPSSSRLMPVSTKPTSTAASTSQAALPEGELRLVIQMRHAIGEADGGYGFCSETWRSKRRTGSPFRDYGAGRQTEGLECLRRLALPRSLSVLCESSKERPILSGDWCWLRQSRLPAWRWRWPESWNSNCRCRC